MTQGSTTFPSPITLFITVDKVITTVAGGADKGTGGVIDESLILVEEAGVGEGKLTGAISVKTT